MVSFSFSLWGFIFKSKKIKKADWVIIQSPPLPVSFSATVLFKKIFNKKVALNVSDLWPLSALELGAMKKGRLYNLLEKIERFNYKNTDLIIGQSDEILEHIRGIVSKKDFLYRNIPNATLVQPLSQEQKGDSFKIVYAGLLGVAQGIYNIIENIDFGKLGVEFHIYGNGNEKDKIIDFIEKNPTSNVFYNGTLSKTELSNKLITYHAALVPLVNNIKGAVPSKIFELMHLGIPLLFCGGGEGAKIVDKYKIGFTSPPSNYNALSSSILKMKDLRSEEYEELKKTCLSVALEDFNFEKQMSNLLNQFYEQ